MPKLTTTNYKDLTMFKGKVIQDVAVEKSLQELEAQTGAALAPVESAIEDLQYKVPAAPEVAGTYVLKATVAADLSVTFAWVSAS